MRLHSLLCVTHLRTASYSTNQFFNMIWKNVPEFQAAGCLSCQSWAQFVFEMTHGLHTIFKYLLMTDLYNVVLLRLIICGR